MVILFKKISGRFGLVILFMALTQSAFAMRQPAMENAIRALDNAERILKKALPNKGGHRAKALRHIRKAREEIRKGIDFANRRGAGGQLKKKIGPRDDRNDEYRSKKKYKNNEEHYDEKEKVIQKRY